MAHTSGTIGLSVLFSIPFLQIPALLFTVLTVTMHWTDTYLLGLQDLFLNGNIQPSASTRGTCSSTCSTLLLSTPNSPAASLGMVKSSCNPVQAAWAFTTVNNLIKMYNFILYLPSHIIWEDSEHLTPLVSSLLKKADHFPPVTQCLLTC